MINSAQKILIITILAGMLCGQYYNPCIQGTGESQLIVFQNTISCLEPGDEIGIFDTFGRLNSGDCSDVIGEIRVGAGTWEGSQISVSAIGSIDFCGLGGSQQPGYIENHPVVVRVWRESNQTEYEASMIMAFGTGNFGDLFMAVSEMILTPRESILLGCTDICGLDFEPSAEEDNCTCEYPPVGDVTLDGEVDISDVVDIIGYIFLVIEPDECQFQFSDVTGDGLINIEDIVHIVGIIFGVI